VKKRWKLRSLYRGLHQLELLLICCVITFIGYIVGDNLRSRISQTHGNEPVNPSK